ncbi:DUF2057 family protein [Vibrio sp. Vf1514]|uniref:DUF2057 family protein n=1 Tax=Vibrio sp. Vf1514 TaxID=3437381 RepID=UPI003F888D31
MKVLKSCLILGISAFSVAAHADAKLELPEFIDLIAVNGMKPVIDKAYTDSRSVTLPDGTNQIVFKFEPMVEDNDGMRRVYSDVVVTKFATADTSLTFELPKYRRLSQARKDIKTFEWALKDASGKSIDLISDTLDSNGVQLGRNYIQDVLDYNQKGGVASIPVAGFTYAKTLPVNAQQRELTDTENVAQLKLWYTKASVEEREAFRQWVVDQD